ncbi:MAG: nitroreductase [Robiginitomaculum sp.]|nr:MAG: nitroreductase [Robiginitomaculum sp.]
MPRFPAAPAFGAEMPSTGASEETLSFLANRRSTPVRMLGAPGPSGEDLQSILQLAMRVPDHRCLFPWRFLVFEGPARQKAGDIFAARFATLNPDAAEKDVACEQERFNAAPVVVAVISSPDHDHKTPVWEQELSAGALCYNLLLVANAAGWAGNWVTHWMAFDSQIAAQFGLKGRERFAGFIHLGTAKSNLKERRRPLLDERLGYWTS